MKRALGFGAAEASHTAPTPPRLSGLELASGVPLGTQPHAPPLAPVEATLSARVALEEAIRRCLVGGRCVIGFSGGRDSSAMLALAVHVARRDDLPLPVPATLRYREVPKAEESAWQELVMRHLALDDWVRMEVGDEHDYLGPVAQPVLRRHGVLWPPYFHSYQPLMALAAGGVFMTGVDGDNLFAGWRWARLEPVRRRAVRPRMSDLGRLTLIAGPPLVRRLAARRHPLPCTWLTPVARRVVNARWFSHYAAEPVRWDHRVEWLTKLRGLALEVSTLDVLGRDCGATVANPLLDRRFLAALARQGGRAGCGDRTVVMESLFADLLPSEVVSRSTKAVFGPCMWRGASQRFAAAWDGSGTDPALVDVGRLRAEWAKPFPAPASMPLLQQAWLAGAEVGTDRTGYNLS
ncbi:MAG TPA: asparagine synthase-related protein [Acidimicrobiales bacterium]|nr:asparagine synthase-related protein [Acidimicrobiales bacterium]